MLDPLNTGQLDHAVRAGPLAVGVVAEVAGHQQGAAAANPLNQPAERGVIQCKRCRVDQHAGGLRDALEVKVVDHVERLVQAEQGLEAAVGDLPAEVLVRAGA